MCGPPEPASTVTAIFPMDSYDPAPGLTLSQIRAAIPKRCFEKSAARSVYYLIQDLAILAVLYQARPYFCFAWWAPTRFIWWNLVGFFGWSLFVVGHDAGHGSFSKSPTLNFVLGHVAHTPLLVPFVGWQSSHRKHHLNHNHVENDHSWKPLNRTDYLDFMSGTLSKFFRCTYGLLLIYPLYLLSSTGDHVSGNHFNPFDRKLFDSSQTLPAAFSTVCIVAWLGFLFSTWDVLTLLDAYFVPYLIFAAWLSLVTYLQHTDPLGVYYRDGEWTYLKGALSTIDRSYGSVINYFHHNIETHVVHHILFTSIPHYHLKEATAAVRPLLGSAYLYDARPFYTAFLDNVRKCRWVDNDGKVVKYQQQPTTKELGETKSQ